jgi:hypothetical protein
MCFLKYDMSLLRTSGAAGQGSPDTAPTMSTRVMRVMRMFEQLVRTIAVSDPLQKHRVP